MKLLQHLGLAIFVALVLVPTSAYAQQQKFNFGVRTGLWAENADPFIGVEALTPLTDRIFFNPNVQYVSRDEGADRLVVNADVHYDFPTRPDRFLWAGAGAAGTRFARRPLAEY